MNYSGFVALVVLAVLSAGGNASAGGFKGLDSLKNKLTHKKRSKSTKVEKAQAAAPAPTCNAVSSMGLCYSFAGKKNAEEKPRKGNEMACKFMKGRFLASDSCPAAKALGKCTVKAGEPEEYSLYYYRGGRLNRSSAEKDCKNPKSGIHAQGAGRWTAF